MKKLTPDRKNELFGPDATVITTYEKITEGKYTKKRHTIYEENPISKVRRIVGMDAVKISVRTCLGCSEKFESEGIHNRMCQECASYRGMI